jgi:hypothetical protein
METALLIGLTRALGGLALGLGVFVLPPAGVVEKPGRGSTTLRFFYGVRRRKDREKGSGLARRLSPCSKRLLSASQTAIDPKEDRL